MKELYRFRQFLTEGVIKEMNEFETADEFVDDGRYYVAVEDNEKGGEWIIDPNQSKYTRGTKTILFTLDEQGYKFTNPEDYFLQVQRMEALKNEAEAEQLISRYGTDLVDQLELHKDWSCAMDPEDCDDDDDDDDEVYEGILKEDYDKESLLKALGDADDAFIQLSDGRELIIYNPNSNNDDNVDMWGDYGVFAVSDDGDEEEVLYSDIAGINL